MGLENRDRGGVRRGQARVQVEQVVLRHGKVVALARAREGDNGDAGDDGGVFAAVFMGHHYPFHQGAGLVDGQAHLNIRLARL